MTGLAEAAAALLGGSLKSVEPLPGGDLSQILRIRLDDGRSAVVKSGPAPRREARMLEALAAAGAPAPAVLAVDGTVLVLELLPAGGSLDGAWAALGTVLARLHGATAGRYGWTEDYAFGPVAIPNGWSDDWPAFWAERRLLADVADLPAALGRRLEALAGGLADRLPRRPPPALLHGDLWGGNVLVEGNRVSDLIDPACYHGHGEVDVAMLGLFGRPGPAFFETYGALPPGQQERLAIYRLWPALVHLRLFGAGYRPLVERLLETLGS
ncbi:Fructosamine-3-kinase [Tistlia consotensis]|uniref:Fructosamine-3-kinase n=1 Tax=Tistlia consotensis USBA 355 TaxID=560819 RepID=A0A1Y6CPS2_9PROT|nr:fructosamine kinase family protein [Tistlia consotensis]SMF80981.1 Fructosamine-3-kinase [Tistlia consotensis USBA 355]SNS22240.1 Fructosamine-3-kinase [Tistlia consotensis]